MSASHAGIPEPARYWSLDIFSQIYCATAAASAGCSVLLLTKKVSPEPPWNSSIVPFPPSITGNLITEIFPFTAASSASQSPFNQLPINIIAARPCLNAATASSSDVPIALSPNPPLAAKSCTYFAASINSGVL